MNTCSYSNTTFNKLSIAVLGLAACGNSGAGDSETVNLYELTVEEIEEKAQEEGEVNSVGMPESWANWEETWADLNEVYGLDHTDTDMSSAEELATFENEK